MTTRKRKRMLNRDYLTLCKRADALQKENKALRRGQALFNALYEQAPDLANTIRGTDLDPFYDDKKIQGLSDWLEDVIEIPA